MRTSADVADEHADGRLRPARGTQRSREEAVETAHWRMMIISGLIALLGIGLAYLMHLQNRGRRCAGRAGSPWPRALLEHKYWVDEIYQAGIVEPLRMLGRCFFELTDS